MPGSAVACRPAADTREKREARAGCSEAGTYADNADNDCKAGLTAIEPPTEPLTDPPKCGAAVTPATMEDIAADTSGSIVAEGVAETRDKRDEMIGWIEVGSCETREAKELSAGLIAIGPLVGTLIPATMDDTIDDILGSRAAVGVAEICESSEDMIGLIEVGN